MKSVVVLLLVAGLALAQGPKKDVGANVPLPEIKDEKSQTAPDKQLNLPKVKTLSVDVNLINVDVVVTDEDGHAITGLTKDQFKIFDDNAPQQITNFNLGDEQPLTVAILVEFSGTFVNFNIVKPPVSGFISSLQPNDWAALITYDRRPTIVTDLTKNRNELEAGLNSLGQPRFREAALYDSLYETLQMMENTDGRKAIFLVGSGFDTADFNTHSYVELLKKTEASDTAIYAVSLVHLGVSAMTRVGGLIGNGLAQADNVLGSVAANSGGAAFFPEYPQQLPSIYQMVNAQARNQYSLGFVPTNRTADGKFHKLRVEVVPLHLNAKGKPDKLKIHYKQGYYAANP